MCAYILIGRNTQSHVHVWRSGAKVMYPLCGFPPNYFSLSEPQILANLSGQ